MKSEYYYVGLMGSLFSMMTWSNLASATFSAENQIKAFKDNPKAFMHDQKNVQKFLQNYVVVPKSDGSDEIHFTSEAAIPQKSEYFSSEMINDRSFVTVKNQFNEASNETYREGRAPIDLRNDNPANLVDSLVYTKLEDMDRHGLKRASLSTSPWSSTYWPTYSGGLAMRYADPNFPGSEDWNRNYEYIINAMRIYGDVNYSSTDNLSPAEKYDLLVGDDNMTLTKSALADGQSSYQKYGKVETWMGICHGWAPAAFMEDRASHAIKVTSPKGGQITFYPSDIKALASLLWAKAPPKSRFIGQRCNLKDPATDANGRIIDQTCFDTNPGTWHQVVVNQIGVNKRSFVLDATYDYEVWNQPAFAYEYTYFNPQTGQVTNHLAEAMVSREEFTDDKFRNWRTDPRAVNFVGVQMKFIYVAETRPTTDKKDSSNKDRLIAVNYLYDLELDADGNIIGGEWYHHQHPDFMWVPEPDAIAKSTGDLLLDKEQEEHEHWKNREHKSIPRTWQEAAVTSSKYGQPLNRVVKELIQKANQKSFLGFIKFNFGRIVQ